MKRARGEETPFGGRAAGPQASNNRILTTTQTNQGQTVQYQMAPSVLRAGNTASENSAMGQGPTVQYTTTYSNSQINPGNVPRSVTPSQPGGQQQHLNVTTPVNTANSLRHKGGGQGQPPPTITTFVGASPQSVPPPPGQTQFQRLKVEDALSYLDKVKYKFEKQPQVYNDFLDIMKEFKSQTIDTPGVIQRVSNLFKGHPELIVGFNTFLPPGYKIEVQANDQGYAYQVSVSLPPPSVGSGISQPSPPHRGPIQMVHTIPTAVNLMTHQPVTQPPNLHVTTQQHPTTPIPTAAATTTPTLTFSRERTISGSGGNLSNTSGGNTPSIGTSNSSTTPTLNASTGSGIRTNDISEINHLHHLTHSAVLPPESSLIGSVTGAEGAGAYSETNTQNQPVEFTHAISYVNKIKNRFHNQPEKYKKFLEILHTYQKEQKIVKEVNATTTSPNKLLTEAEVFTQVAKLFVGQEDLLREFGQFLPDATSHSGLHLPKLHSLNDHKKLTSVPTGPHPNLKSYNNSQNNISRLDRDYHPTEKEYPREKERNHISGPKFGQNSAQVKKSPSYNAIPISHIGRDREGPPPPKRHKPICKDVTLAEASKFGSLHDYSFFDKVRKALRSPEVYDNFLRCLTLFNQEIISKSELLNLVSPFLSKFPDLQRWFQDFIGPSTTPESVPLASAQRQERTQSELAQEIDLSSCKRLGASYCALPKSSEIKKCSGRTTLCKDVLNDTWVSFPTWAEDSTFVTSRKTQYEEIIYRCEDERFELDVVIETNSATIRVLEGVQKKLSRMTPEEVTRFRLDDCLGGSSPTIHQRALRRIYGEKSPDIIQGLKRNPVVAVPVVLRRLKAKEEEWREAQKGFNKQWREQNEKYYLKSLDHQGITFKQNDIKALRSKSLFNEIETLYDERHEQNDEGTADQLSGPHLILNYKDKTILEDAANLLIHHVKRQTGIQKQEKTKIKHILRQFVPDIFFAPRQQLSDDERDDDDKEMEIDNSDNESKLNINIPTTSNLNNLTLNNKLNIDVKKKTPSNSSSNLPSPSILPQSQSIIPSSSSSPSTAASILSSNLMNIKSESGEQRTQNLMNDLCNLSSNNNTNNSLSNSINIKNNDGNSLNKSDVEIKTEKDSDINMSGSTVPPHAVSKFSEEAYTLFFANNNWYLFLRLHAILCERLRTMYERAQNLAIEEAKYRSNRRESTATALRLKPKSEVQVEDYYPTFLDMLKNVLDGNMDTNNYEDNLREMFGIHAYIAFTLDRVVSNAVRQLQHCVTERGAIECVDLFHQEQRKTAAGGLCKTSTKRVAAELTYQRKAEASLQDENCFKVYIYKIDCRITIELLDTESDDTEKSISTQQEWSNYVERLGNPAAGPINASHRTGESGGGGIGGNSTNKVEIKTEKEDDLASVPRKPLFLPRNIRRFNSTHTQLVTSNTGSSTILASQLTEEQEQHGNSSVFRKDDSLILTEISSSSTTITGKSILSNVNAAGVGGSGLLNSSSGVIMGDVNNPSEKKKIINVDDVLWKKGNLERLGGSDVNSSYIVDDRQEIKLNIQSYKMVYVMHKDGIFYKKNSINRARMTHPKVTKSRQLKFYGFVKKWLDRNTIEANRSQCSDWLMGRSPDLVPNITTILQENDITKTPYSIYNRYKVERLES